MLGMSGAAHAQGQAGTTLSVTKTATGFYERRIQYTWTITKDVDPKSIAIGLGATGQVTYQITTSRTPSITDTFGVRGEICVTNGGAVATAELIIKDVVQSKKAGEQFHDVIGYTVPLGNFPQLAAGQSHCYPYEITSPGPISSGTSYRNQARVTITNHSGHLGDPFGPSPNAGFSLPTDPTITETDESATVTDVEQCPAGFTCIPSNPGPFPFLDPGSVSFTKDITNNTACGDAPFAVTNIATLETNDTATRIPAERTIAGIDAPECPVLPPGGCTFTQGYWKTHEDVWPVTILTLGTFEYTQEQLLQILDKSVQGNGLVSLAHQLITAKLNVNNGATTPPSVANDITIADNLIGNKVVPPVGTGYLAPGDTSDLVENLTMYNEGNAQGGSPHCE
jgi:hypothetical protein